MKIMFFICDFIIPILCLIILLHGFLKKVNIYDCFVEGAKEGCDMMTTILPTLVGLMISVGIIRDSGVLDMITSFLAPLAQVFAYPKELIPLTFMRPISYSGSTGFLLDIYKQYGPDSFLGRSASVLMGCAETILYTMSVYFVSIKVKNTGYTLAGAIISTLAGTLASVYLVKFIFK